MSNTSKKDEIFVTFTFKKNGEQIYIDVDKNTPLRQALSMLVNKYNWLAKIKKDVTLYIVDDKTKRVIRSFTTDNLDRRICKLGIKDNTDIIIDCEPANAQEKQLFNFENFYQADNQQINQNFNNNNFNLPNNFQPNQNFNNFQNNQFQLNNFQNQFFNNVHMLNNMQNNIQNQPFYKSVRLQTIFNYLTTNGFCLPTYKDRALLIQFLNKLYNTGIYNKIPGDKVYPLAWHNFRSLTTSNKRNYMEAVYRIFYLCPKDNQQAQLKFLECAGITMDDLLKYANSRKNIPNNQNMNQNSKMVNNNNMNMMNQNNMNNQNNFNLMSGFLGGDWLAVDNRSIETLMQAAGIKCDKITLFNNICRAIDLIDKKLQNSQDQKESQNLTRQYCLAMDFLRRYYSQEIAQWYPYNEYPLFFNMYDYSQRFVPSYADLNNGQRIGGRITFYNPAINNFDTIQMQEYNDLRPLPKFTKNKGCTCYLDSARNSILHNRYTKAILNRIGQSLSMAKWLGIENYPNGIRWEEIKKLNDFELLAVFAYASEWAYNNPNCNQLCENIIDVYFTELEKANPLFKRRESGDVKDYYNYVSLQLKQKIHQGINLQSNIQQDINLQSNPALQANPYITYNNFTNEMATQETSLFCEPKGTKTYCHNCNGVKYNFELFYFLENPMHEVKKYTNNRNFLFNNNILYTLDDCLWYDQKTDIFTGKNMIWCNFCKRLCNASYGNLRTNSCNLPHLVFNTGKNNCFPERIYLDQYYKTPDGDYLQLVSFEIYVPGHFMSLHKVFDGQKYQWYLFNDMANEAEIVDDRVIDQLLHYQYTGTLGHGISTCHAPFTVRAADYQPIARQRAIDITYSPNIFGLPQENVHILFGLGQTKYGKLFNPLYNVFYNPQNNNFGEPNPNNPYTAVLGLQKLLIDLGLDNLIGKTHGDVGKKVFNVLTPYNSWNDKAGVSYYGENLKTVQRTNNVFMKNFVLPQQFIPLNNKNVNMNMKQGNNMLNK